jgi:hypothetical protein
MGTPAFHPMDEELSMGTPGWGRADFTGSGRLMLKRRRNLLSSPTAIEFHLLSMLT